MAMNGLLATLVPYQSATLVVVDESWQLEPHFFCLFLYIKYVNTSLRSNNTSTVENRSLLPLLLPLGHRFV
jgi:hypothetical protein